MRQRVTGNSSSLRRVQRREGFTLVEMMIVVAVIGLLAAIAIPNYVQARSSAQVKACIYNLTQIQEIKSQWALDNKKKDLDLPTAADLAPYFRDKMLPPCPGGGTYRIRRVVRDPVCSLAINGHTLNNLNMDNDPAAD